MLVMKTDMNNSNNYSNNKLDRYRDFEDNWFWMTDDPEELQMLNELWRTIWSPKYVKEANDILLNFSDAPIKKLLERRALATFDLLDGTTKTGNDDMVTYYASRRLAMDLLFIKIAIEQKRDLSNLMGYNYKDIYAFLDEYVNYLGEHSKMKAMNLYKMQPELAVIVIQDLRELAYEYHYANVSKGENSLMKDTKVKKKKR